MKWAILKIDELTNFSREALKTLTEFTIELNLCQHFLKQESEN